MQGNLKEVVSLRPLVKPDDETAVLEPITRADIRGRGVTQDEEIYNAPNGRITRRGIVQVGGAFGVMGIALGTGALVGNLLPSTPHLPEKAPATPLPKPTPLITKTSVAESSPAITARAQVTPISSPRPDITMVPSPPVPTPSITPQIAATPTQEVIQKVSPETASQRLRGLMLSALTANTTAGEFNALNMASKDELEFVLSMCMKQEPRTQGLIRLWDFYIQGKQTEGKQLNVAYKNFLDDKQYGKGQIREAQTLGKGIFYPVILNAIDAANEFATRVSAQQRVPAWVIAAIGHIETFSSIDFNNYQLPNDATSVYAKYFLNVKPGGFTIFEQENKRIKGLNALVSNGSGAIGYPQVAPDTLGVIAGKKRNGTNLNPYDLFEGALAIAYILVNKGWNANNQASQLQALRGYCGGSYEQYFTGILSHSQQFEYLMNTQPLWLPIEK